MTGANHLGFHEFEKIEVVHKPGSVFDCHLSGSAVSYTL